jgi:hypothetical protein
MALGAEKRKVGLVTFNNEVQIIGDGAQDPQIVTGDKLMNYEFLSENGKKAATTHLNKTIGET